MSAPKDDAGVIGCAPLYRRRHLDQVTSTNALLLEAARGGEAGNLWLSADRQTAGRGRRGRTWVSQRGNLYASLLLIEPCARQHLGELPLVSGVALADAVEAVTGRIGFVTLKWPNDLLVGDAKLSGILLESEVLADGRLALVAGFGVNCAHHPDEAAYPATDLAVLGYPVGVDALFARLAEAMATRLEQWHAGRGFGIVRSAWLNRCAGLGAPVTVRLPNRTLEGIFRAIDGEGRLVLETADEMTTISAGDVFFADQAQPPKE